MIMLDSLRMAFSLYSIIPVPHAQWNEKSMKYCICFLPLIGGVVAAVQYLAFKILSMLSFGDVFRGAVLSVLPVLITGGIHLDGFLDTCDAIHSYGSREKRLEILKDPHVGAFAVLGGIVYFILDLGIWTEAGKDDIPLLCLLFVLSRTLSAFAAVTFPKAKKDGMLRQETDPAASPTAVIMAAATLVTGAVMLVLSPAFAFPMPAVCALLAAMAVFLYYRQMAVKIFGGTTGDLSGWFTQTCELVAAMAALFVCRCA